MRLTSDSEVGLSLEVFRGEPYDSRFVHLNVPQTQAVDLSLCPEHRLTGNTE